MADQNWYEITGEAGISAAADQTPADSAPADGNPNPALPADPAIPPCVELSPERRLLLEQCQVRLGYEFIDPHLLISAITHASSAGSRVCSNERLEFLGDAVLGLVVCEQLYLRFPTLLEGELTKIKSSVVSRNTCARIAQHLGMQELLILGKGMALQSSIPKSVLADCFESLIAAIFLDGGMEPARQFILAHLQSDIESAANGRELGNHKSQLQQFAQREFAATPVYETLREQGPDHRKSFLVAAVIKDQTFAPAWGRNKKDAEQRAALNALCHLQGQAIPFSEHDLLAS